MKYADILKKYPAFRNGGRKKSAEYLDYSPEFLESLDDATLLYLSNFCDSFYNGNPQIDEATGEPLPGSIPAKESYRLDNERRRDIMNVEQRVDCNLDQIVEAPSPKRAFGDEWRNYRSKTELRKKQRKNNP